MSDTAQQERFVDLHLHTNHSDGSDTPRRVVERAAELNIAAMAITDHDTVSGVPEAAEAAVEFGIRFLPGVEISSTFKNREVHILGLGVDISCATLTGALDTQMQGRNTRAEIIVARLNELDVSVHLKKVLARTGDGVIGRMHIAKEIVEVGAAKSVQDAFRLYIKSGRPAYVPKDVLAVDKAIEIIHAARGLAIIAHPGLGGSRERLEALLEHPFDGLEVIHSRHTAAMAERFQSIARERGLLFSGGSDCHGTVKGEKPLMGTVRVPYEIFDRLEQALAAKAASPAK